MFKFVVGLVLGDFWHPDDVGLVMGNEFDNDLLLHEGEGGQEPWHCSYRKMMVGGHLWGEMLANSQAFTENLTNRDTIGPDESVLFIEVSLIQELFECGICDK